MTASTAEGDPRDVEERPDRILVVEGAVRHFGGIPAVDGMDLHIDAGEVVALIGPNGAGKSTLLKLINGMLRPASLRSMTFEGRDIAGQAPHQLRQAGIATVTQTPRAFERLTVIDDVLLGAMFGAGPRRTRLAAARQLALQALADLGLAARADQPVATLTAHQKRLTDLARALAGRPRLLLIDEVMAGLNPSELEPFVERLDTLKVERRLSILCVEHVMWAVKALADRVVVMQSGRELCQGAPAQVIGDERVVAAYLGGQRGSDVGG